MTNKSIRRKELRLLRNSLNIICDLTEIRNGVLFTEKWAYIPGFNNKYQISDFGRVKSFVSDVNKINGKLLKQRIAGMGYYYVMLYNNTKRYNVPVHRLVAMAFIQNIDNKPEVNHIGVDKNGIVNKADNRSISLEWVTRKENEQHKILSGNGINGERHWKSRLKEKDILFIRTSLLTYNELSIMFNIHRNHVSDIKNRRRRKTN